MTDNIPYNRKATSKLSELFSAAPIRDRSVEPIVKRPLFREKSIPIKNLRRLNKSVESEAPKTERKRTEIPEEPIVKHSFMRKGTSVGSDAPKIERKRTEVPKEPVVKHSFMRKGTSVEPEKAPRSERKRSEIT